MNAYAACEPVSARCWQPASRGEAVRPDVLSLISDLKACSTSRRNLQKGVELHAEATRKGIDSSINVANTLVSMYARCGSMVSARRVFDSIKEPVVVSWNALISGYAANGESTVSLELFYSMTCQGCNPDPRTLVAVLKACTSLVVKQGEIGKVECIELGKGLHSLASAMGYHVDCYVQSSLIDLYAKCGRMVEARRVFDSMEEPTVVSWTSLIFGYAESGEGDVALELFTKMRSEGCEPTFVTFLAAIKACAALAQCCGQRECRDRGRHVHLLASQNGWSGNFRVQSALIDMYAKCGSMADAREVFESMERVDVVAWTALILGYAENREGSRALDLFEKMRSQGCAPDSTTFIAAFKACSSLALEQDLTGRAECRERAKHLHLLASENGCHLETNLQNTLIDMYANCSSMVDARRFFDTLRCPNIVSWNALILGYAENEEGDMALELFSRMKSGGWSPDSRTFVAALKACSLLGALEFGRRIHVEADTGNELDLILVNCLVDFYARCGSVEEARKVFDSKPGRRNLTTWNSLLAGHSRLGDTGGVFGLFQSIQDAGLQPDGVTFASVLTCCSHAGLVEKGRECFESMSTKYRLVPNVVHWNCMVDLLGRSNKLDEAMALLRTTMPCSPNVVTWMTVLGACRKWRNAEIGRQAFESVLSLDDTVPAAYVVMAHIYGSRGMWEEQERVLGMRRKSGAWKMPGQSWWTNEFGEVHRFLVGESRHPQIDQIHNKLEAMVVMLRKHGYVANPLSISRNITDADKEEALCGHSERLAIACALINTQPGITIRIMKNLRVCDDCHVATALISKLEHRTIMCRDTSRFHVFENGKCSCGDFW